MAKEQSKKIEAKEDAKVLSRTKNNVKREISEWEATTNRKPTHRLMLYLSFVLPMRTLSLLLTACCFYAEIAQFFFVWIMTCTRNHWSNALPSSLLLLMLRCRVGTLRLLLRQRLCWCRWHRLIRRMSNSTSTGTTNLNGVFLFPLATTSKNEAMKRERERKERQRKWQ